MTADLPTREGNAGLPPRDERLWWRDAVVYSIFVDRFRRAAARPGWRRVGWDSLFRRIGRWQDYGAARGRQCACRLPSDFLLSFT